MREHIKVFQANVGRGGPNHDAALHLAAENQCQAVLIQEPFAKDMATKTHPAYQLFLPSNRWDSTPKVLTYVHKDVPAAAVGPRDTSNIITVHLTDSNVTLINVYRPPNEGRGGPIRTQLERLNCETKTMVGGDFNAVAPTWQDLGTPRGGDTDIKAWFEKQGLWVLNEPDEATHDDGNVLDLAATNISGATMAIEEHLHTGSDHQTLVTTFTAQDRRRPPRVRLRPIPSEECQRLAKDLIPEIKEFQSPRELDEYTQRLVEAVAASREAQDQVKGSGRKGTPWWTDKVQAAHRAWTRLRNQHEKVQFRSALRKAKRDHWKGQISGADTPEKAFELAKWHKKPPPGGEPPLSVGEQEIAAPQEKARAFLAHLLGKATQEAEEPEEGPPRTAVPLDLTIHPGDLEECLIKAKNKARGEDQITTAVIKSLWNCLHGPLKAIYEASIRLGYYPKPFRKAKVIMLTKPGRRDLTKINSYRPISLLSCLGKGLERLLARRLAYASVQYAVLATTQASALPKRSSLDLVAALVSDIEKALQKKQSAALLLLDVKGAFDAVSHSGLLNRLRLQGWPQQIRNWIESFLTDRSITLHYGAEKTSPATPHGGLPQGSPISPILFLLYVEKVVRAPGATHRYDYADDIASLYVRNDPAAALKALQADYPRMLELGKEANCPFSPEKTEVVIFTRKKKKNIPQITLRGCKPYENPKLVRWLGVYLDPTLSFKGNVDACCNKAKRVGDALKSLSNTQSGAPPQAMLTAIRACAINSALYGTEVWHPGQKDFHGRATQVKGHEDVISRVVAQATRAAIPAYKTAPNAAILREGGIPPGTVLLEDVRRRAAARIRQLDNRHPLVKRIGRPETRLGRLAALAEYRENRPILSPRAAQSPFARGKVEAIQKYKETPPTHIRIYSDGSKLEDGRVGWGYAAWQGRIKIAEGKGSLGRKAEVFDGELAGATRGLQKIVTSPALRLAPHIHIRLDNASAGSALRSLQPTDIDRDYVEPFVEAHKAAREAPLLIGPNARVITTEWIPGHAGVPGNERADELAKEGAQMATSSDVPPSLSWIRHEARSWKSTATQSWWRSAAPERYKELEIPWQDRPKEPKLGRAWLGRLVAARTGHGDFTPYHERFGHSGGPWLCLCGRPKTWTHIFFCGKAKRRWRQERGKAPPWVNPRKSFIEMLATPSGAATMQDYASATGFFTELCPMGYSPEARLG